MRARNRTAAGVVSSSSVVMLVLSIDIGLLLTERRKMQNAADAGALAGAREMCFGSGDPVTAVAVAENWATVHNPYGASQTASASIFRWTMSVDVTEQAETFAAGMIGFDTVPIGAHAEAMCGAADTVCGLWPIAFEV